MNFGLDILTHTGLHPFLNRLREKIILAVWMFFSFFSLAVCCVGMKDADFSNIPLLSKKIEGFIIHLKVRMQIESFIFGFCDYMPHATKIWKHLHKKI